MADISCSCFDEINLEGATDWPLEKLKEALRDALQPKKSPFVLGSLHISTSPIDYVGIIYDVSEDTTYRNRFKTALREMLDSFDSAEKPVSESDGYYLAGLIYAIPWFRVPDAGEIIRNKILSRKYMGVPEKPYVLPVHGSDLHFILLHALLDYPDEKNIPLFKTFFPEKNGLYANICYRGLWENDYAYGLEYLPRFAALYLNKSEVCGNFSVEFGFFLDKHQAPFLEKGLDEIGRACGNNDILTLIANELHRRGHSKTGSKTIRHPLRTHHPSQT